MISRLKQNPVCSVDCLTNVSEFYSESSQSKLYLSFLLDISASSFYSDLIILTSETPLDVHREEGENIPALSVFQWLCFASITSFLFNERKDQPGKCHRICKRPLYERFSYRVLNVRYSSSSFGIFFSCPPPLLSRWLVSCFGLLLL